jgi:hypothetical protein
VLDSADDTLPSYWDQEVSKIAELNAMPEPETMTLLGCALLSCGLLQLRRRLWSTLTVNSHHLRPFPPGSLLVCRTLI